MCKNVLLFIFFMSACFCYGQDTLPRFAIAFLPAISAGTKDDYWLYYSDGRKEDLKLLLNLESEKGEIYISANMVIVTSNEFKLLEYMRIKGFALLAVNYGKMLGCNQFYFECK